MLRLPSAIKSRGSAILTRKKTPTASETTRAGPSMQELGFELDGQPRSFSSFYTVADEELGRGATCTARMAFPIGGGPPCVVKIVDAEERDQVMREAGMLQRLDHPQVCRLVDLFNEDDAIYMVLSKGDGLELFHYIKEGRFSRDHRACAVVSRQILEALKYCHSPSGGVVHRDLKPENIMVHWKEDSDVPDEATLIDFGSAVAAGEQATASRGAAREVFGTEVYMAPEAEDCVSFGSALDMWSFGAVLHTMLTGEYLPESARWSEEPGQYLGAQWARSRVPLAAQDLLMGLLQVDPEERLTALEALQHPWILGDCDDEDTKELECEPSTTEENSSAEEHSSSTEEPAVAEEQSPSPGYGHNAEEEEEEKNELQAITRMVQQLAEHKIRLLKAFCVRAQVAEDGGLEAKEVRRCAALAGLDDGDLDTLVLLSARLGQAEELLLAAGGEAGASLYSRGALLDCLEAAAEVAAEAAAGAEEDGDAAAEEEEEEGAGRRDATGNVACEGSGISPRSSRWSSAAVVEADAFTCVKDALSDKSTSPGTTPRSPGQGLGLESPEEAGQDSAEVLRFALLEKRQPKSGAPGKERGHAASLTPLRRQHDHAADADPPAAQSFPATPSGSRSTELTTGGPPRSL